LALVFGGSAALGIHTLWSQGPGGMGTDLVSVVVAAADVPRGATLTSTHLKIRDCPKDMVPAGAFARTEDVLERVLFTPLVKDEPVLEGKLATKGAGRGMAALIPRGMRAFTIQTPNVASGVGGFILPGNKVDVLLTVSTLHADDKTGGGSTTTLLQNVEILAVDQRVHAPADNKVDVKELRSVTLLVTPDQATKLDLGQNKGTLHLSLRNPEDSQPADTRPATLADLRFHQEKPWDERAKGVLEAVGKIMAQQPARQDEPAAAPAAPEPPPSTLIRTLRGTQEGVVIIQTEDRGQRTEDRGQRTEDRGQNPDD
jgi:pilus assembly protein CpaB